MKVTVCTIACLLCVGSAQAQKSVNAPPPPRVSAEAAGGSAPGEMVAGQRLLRNGVGFRMKGTTKVNQIEIFAAKKFSSLEALNRLDGPKRVAVTVLTEVPSNFMGKGLTRGIEDNTSKAELSTLVPMLIRMGELFNQHKTLGVGSKVLIDWVPGQGMVLSINGAVQGEPFREAALFRAMMGIWLGNAPVDAELKAKLLGAGSV